MAASRVPRVCGYVTRTDKGQQSRRPCALVRTVMRARGTEPSIEVQTVATLVPWTSEINPSTRQKPPGKAYLAPI
jgi:hypothetical protein